MKEVLTNHDLRFISPQFTYGVKVFSFTNILILRIFIANSILDQSTQRITFDSLGNLDFPLLG
jgi:hypothetical protein